MNIDFEKIRSEIRGERLNYLGSGAGRRVYDTGNGYVVKVAMNQFGLTQNKNEYRLSLMYTGELLAKVLSVSEGHKMLAMQAAKPLHQIKPVLDYFNVETRKGLYYVPELADLVKTHHLVMREFLVSRNWGLINNKPVIIDYGFAKRRRRFRLFGKV